MLKTLPESAQGIFLMIFGLILLLHSLGIFATLTSSILVLISLGLIVYGFLQSGLQTKVLAIIQKKK